MPNFNPSVTQVTYISPEATHGTAMTSGFIATKALSLEDGIQTTRTPFRPQGRRWNTLTIAGKEWAAAPLRGVAVFGELPFGLCGLLGTVTPTQIGTLNAYQWDWSPSAIGVIDPQTYTVQKGNSTRARQYTYGLVTEFGMGFNNRDSIETTGAMLMQRITDGATLASGTALGTVEIIPLLPEKTGIYMDNTAGAIGGTQLDTVLAAAWRINNFNGVVWTIDDRKTSYSGHVNLVPMLELDLTLNVDGTTGMDPLTAMRAVGGVGAQRYVRIKNTGPAIGSVNYLYQHDLAMEVKNVQPFADDQGVHSIRWTFNEVDRLSTDVATSIRVINGAASL